MSRIWIFGLLLLCLNWTLQGLGLCSNVTRLECQGFYCPGSGRVGGGCEYDRTLRKSLCNPSCSNDPHRDPCTCLAIYEGCHIRVNATDAASSVTFTGASQTTYSCVNSSAVRNCNYDVHVLSAFRGNGDLISWNNVLGTGSTSVDINVSGLLSNRSLVLVLLSHYPTYWMLNVPSGLTIAKVLLSSYHVDVSEVSYPTGSVLSVEKVSNRLLPSLAYGFDEYGDHVMQALDYLTQRFGSVSSFTGAYQADKFALSIHGEAQDQFGCVPFVAPGAISSPVISSQCHPTIERGVCFVYSFRATCSGDGYCRCPNLANRDPCTCLAKFGSCIIEKTARGDNSAGKPSYQRRPQITYSCVANDNCQHSVHVISTYEAVSTGFAVRSAPITVRITVSGDEADTKPMILVLTSYYPVRWSLSIPQGVVFERVIVSSYFRYISQTSVRYSTGSVLNFEKLNCSGTVGCYADGYGDSTVQQLQYVSNRFGPVSSWSSAYRTDTWNLNIERKSGCDQTSSPTTSNSASLCPVIPTNTGPSSPPFITRPVSTNSASSDSNNPPFVVPPRTSSSSSSGIAIGVGTTVGVLLLAAGFIIPLMVIVVLLSKRKAGGGTTRHLGHLPPPQQQIFYTQQNQLQQSSIHYSAQTRTGIQTNTYAATSVNTQSPVATLATFKPVLSKLHTSDLTDSAPPGYDEALNYPVPTAKGSKLPPPYSQ